MKSRDYDKYQLNEASQFGALLIHLVNKLPIRIPLIKTIGRPRTDERDIIICLVLKSYFRLSYRLLYSLMKIMKSYFLISEIPNYSLLCKRMKNKKTFSLLQRLFLLSCLPIKDFEDCFAIDSSGMTVSNPSQYYTLRAGKYRRYDEFKKLNIISSVRFNVITSVILSQGRGVHDSKFFQELFDDTLKYFVIKAFSGDTAYCSKLNVGFLNQMGIKPYLKPSVLAKSSGGKSFAWKRMVNEFKSKSGDWNKGYGLRNNVETSFSSLKRRFGQEIRSLRAEGQFSETLCKVIAYNLTQLLRASVTEKIPIFT